MVMAGRSVHLTPRSSLAVNQYFVHILSLVTDNKQSSMSLHLALRLSPYDILFNEGYMRCMYKRSGPEVIKLFIMLNSTEHEISTAHKN